jgi:hypothetical protein
MGPVGDITQFIVIGVLTDGIGDELLLAEEETALAESEAIESAAGGACFVGGTMVQTATGAKRIEDVVAGDEVISEDIERGAPDTRVRRQVTRTFVHDAPAVLDIRVGNTVITGTPEHPFWVVGHGWRPAGELQPGSTLLTADGRELRVASVRRREGSFKVYNLEVSDAHTYYVSPLGILVHNECAPDMFEGRSGALNDARQSNGIPRSQQPDRVIRPGTPEGNAVGLRPGENVRLYEYTDAQGNKVWIREDAPKTYSDGGSQGPHFNSGPAGSQRLPGHHYWRP